MQEESYTLTEIQDAMRRLGSYYTEEMESELKEGRFDRHVMDLYGKTFEELATTVEPGLKLERRKAGPGDMWLPGSLPFDGTRLGHHGGASQLAVSIDNIYGKRLCYVPIPEGYEAARDAEGQIVFRWPLQSESFIGQDEYWDPIHTSDPRRIILRKKVPAPPKRITKVFEYDRTDTYLRPTEYALVPKEQAADPTAKYPVRTVYGGVCLGTPTAIYSCVSETGEE